MILLALFNFQLTIHVQDKACFLGLHELCVQSLTGKYGVQIRPLNGRPEQSVLDHVARVVLVLIIDL